MSVLWNPLKRLAPALPGQMITSDLSITSVALTLTASSESAFLPNNKGQNVADGDFGTRRVPFAFVAWACCNTHGTRYTGGHHRLFSPCQLHVKASTASVPGFQNLELNLGNCVLKELANRSTECGPHIPSSLWNIAGCTLQSSWSIMRLMKSAC